MKHLFNLICVFFFQCRMSQQDFDLEYFLQFSPAALLIKIWEYSIFAHLENGIVSNIYRKKIMTFIEALTKVWSNEKFGCYLSALVLFQLKRKNLRWLNKVSD